MPEKKGGIFSNLDDTLKKAGLAVGILDAVPEEGATPTQTALPANPTSTPPVSAVTPNSVSADPEMVEKIRRAILSPSHSPRFALFLTHLETAKKAFPNDQKNAVVAAVGFSGVTSAELNSEMDKSIAASFLETDSQIDQDIASRRAKLTEQLEAEASTLNNSIETDTAEAARIQQRLSENKAKLAQIENRRSSGNSEIDQKEATAKASLAAVRAELDNFKQLLP